MHSLQEDYLLESDGTFDQIGNKLFKVAWPRIVGKYMT